MSSLAQDAQAIWRAGVEAVDSARLVRQVVSGWKGGLRIGDVVWRAGPESRICVVGAGKAGAGMAAGLEQAFSGRWLERTQGWVNVPADCVRTLDRIHLHAARPAGINEPTEAGVFGTRKILERVSELGPDDLCLVLISGGGSALLPGPAAAVSLADKLAVTQQLMQAGATIEELNRVRRNLSMVKGGGLLRACRAGTLVSLIISDVAGDPLETIASGPTVPASPDPQGALAVLEKFTAKGNSFPAAVVDYLRDSAPPDPALETAIRCRYRNLIIGNNRTAVRAAAAMAARLGYELAGQEYDRGGVAADVGRDLISRLIDLRDNAAGGERVCVISGGEPTVDLTSSPHPGKGGRNQELVLAGAVRLRKESPAGICLLSGGTDGEDGPTDAAGAYVDEEILLRMSAAGLDPEDALARHDAYPFWERLGALIRTGPTHTNVMDLRVGLAATVNSTRPDSSAGTSI